MSNLTCCGQPMVHIEIPVVYDGALYLECDTCGRRKHRFPEQHGLYRWAAHFVDGRGYVPDQGFTPPPITKD